MTDKEEDKEETTVDIFVGNKIHLWYDNGNSLYAMYFMDRGTTFYFHYESTFTDLKNCLEAWGKYKEYTGDHVSIFNIHDYDKDQDTNDIELLFRYIGSISIAEDETEEIKSELNEIVKIIEAKNVKIGEKWK